MQKIITKMGKGTGSTKSSGASASSAAHTTSSSVNRTMNKVVNFLKISSSKYSDPDRVSIMKTPLGNWALYYNGKSVSTVGKNELSESKLRETGKLLRKTPDIFTSKENAFSFANHAVKTAHVMEVGKVYWVVTPADATRLEKAGYKYAK